MKKGVVLGLGCLGLILVGLFAVGLSVRGSYNDMVALEQDVNSKWSQVQIVYQRRADLIPNLVATVKGYASHESEVLQAVTESRSKAGSIQLTSDILSNPAEFQKFQQAQASLSGALSRLLAVVEKYPDLKANQGFLELQHQLEGTENRIAVERRRFNESAQTYNIRIKQFPANLVAGFFGFREKQYFQAAEGSEKPPVVDFNKK